VGQPLTHLTQRGPVLLCPLTQAGVASLPPEVDTSLLLHRVNSTASQTSFPFAECG
jgi:hypothetical protein